MRLPSLSESRMGCAENRAFPYKAIDGRRVCGHHDQHWHGGLWEVGEGCEWGLAIPGAIRAIIDAPQKGSYEQTIRSKAVDAVGWKKSAGRAPLPSPDCRCCHQPVCTYTEPGERGWTQRRSSWNLGFLMANIQNILVFTIDRG